MSFSMLSFAGPNMCVYMYVCVCVRVCCVQFCCTGLGFCLHCFGRHIYMGVCQISPHSDRWVGCNYVQMLLSCVSLFPPSLSHSPPSLFLYHSRCLPPPLSLFLSFFLSVSLSFSFSARPQLPASPPPLLSLSQPLSLSLFRPVYAQMYCVQTRTLHVIHKSFIDTCTHA